MPEVTADYSVWLLDDDNLQTWLLSCDKSCCTNIYKYQQSIERCSMCLRAALAYIENTLMVNVVAYWCSMS